MEKPTFTPSISTKWSDFTEKGHADYMAWLAKGCPALPKEYKFESREVVCHSYVTDGQIQFLADSTHALAGQTVPLKAF